MWRYFGVALVVLVVLVLLWRFDPDRRRLRQFDHQLAARKPLPDAELVAKFFATDDVPPEIPPQVRRLFASHMGYPAEKLLPDDDFALFWAELDMVDFIKELESEFDIVISRLDVEHTACTIRAVSLLVASKVGVLNQVGEHLDSSFRPSFAK